MKRLSAAQQRLLETADRLFYQEGYRAVGVDRIIAEAGVAKMTLYTYFPSKDDLILAVLRYREEKVLEFFRASMERHTKRGKDKLEAFFATLQDWFQSSGFRGCAFQNAFVELADPAHAGTTFVREHKQRFAELLRDLIEESIGQSAPALAPTIAMLVEGAIMTAAVHRTPDAALLARQAAFTLIERSRTA